MKLGPEEAQRMLEAEQAEAHEKAKKKASKAGSMLSWAVDKMANAVGQVGSNDSDSVNNGDNIDLNSEVFAAEKFRVLGTAAKIVRFNSKRESKPVAKPKSSASGKISRRWVCQQLQSDLRRTAASVVEEFRK